MEGDGAAGKASKKPVKDNDPLMKAACADAASSAPAAATLSFLSI